jgi:hypothetical protein
MFDGQFVCKVTKFVRKDTKNNGNIDIRI